MQTFTSLAFQASQRTHVNDELFGGQVALSEIRDRPTIRVRTGARRLASLVIALVLAVSSESPASALPGPTCTLRNTVQHVPTNSVQPGTSSGLAGDSICDMQIFHPPPLEAETSTYWTTFEEILIRLRDEVLESTQQIL